MCIYEAVVHRCYAGSRFCLEAIPALLGDLAPSLAQIKGL